MLILELIIYYDHFKYINTLDIKNIERTTSWVV